ncbi:MAG: hypothetical protein U9N59_07315 [Campylobacterota bacterium]|nr:hypothetical protein [Campylobacterota bacterium]
MAIPISNIQEGCCDTDLNQYTIIDGDSLDRIGSTCDKIIECHNQYILVEEKSLLFSFFNSCCNEMSQDLETYKYETHGITYLRITDVVNQINTLNIEVKKRLLAENINDLLFSSLKKVSNTTHILDTKFNSAKADKMQTFYLYCNSGKPIDLIMSTWLSRNRKNIFIECNDLKAYLQHRQC